MVKFGEKLVASRRQEWAPYYLDYDRLKTVLENPPAPLLEFPDDGEEAGGTASASGGGGGVANRNNALLLLGDDSTRSVGGGSSVRSLFGTRRFFFIGGGGGERPHPESEPFLQELNAQVEKLVLFFLQEQGRIAYKLVECRQEQVYLDSDYFYQTAGYDDHDELVRLRNLRQKLNGAGEELLQLIQFVDLNVTGIRKILKKHDKLNHWSASRYYLTGQNRRSSYTLLPLLKSEQPLTALCVTLETAISEVRQREAEITGLHVAPMPEGTPAIAPASYAPGHLRAASETVALAAARGAATPSTPVSSAAKSTRQSLQGQDRHIRNMSLSSQQHHEIFMSKMPHPDDAVLARIYAARRRLKQSSEFSEMLAATALLAPGEVPSRSDSFDESDLIFLSAMANTLNLLSTFLYMTNYYIIVPTAGSYAAKLGSSPSYSSMLVGMTPTAALFSTLLYSWWTSYSYKSALIFASSCSVAGNIFYMAGIPYNSLTFVLIGRFLNGFGSARSINRRYIADSYSHAERTAASAIFVAAGALGMAAGPGIASILHMTAENSVSPYWQQENAPGWFMFFVWSVYLICLITFFDDPPKRKPAPSSVEMTEDAKLTPKDTTINGDAELTPLIGRNREGHDPGASNVTIKGSSIGKNIAVLIIFLIYFILKLLLECLLSSTAILAEFYFGWSGSFVGIYMSVLGLLILPANLAVAYLSRNYDDRELIMLFQGAMLAGCLLIMKYSSTYSMVQYVIGSVAVFLSTNMLEGPNMSLLSKTIPKSWSEGFFNVGLLATEAGTLGRAIGDTFLAICGSGGMEYLLDNAFGSMLAMCSASFLISWRYYDLLQPIDKDD